MSTPRAGSAVPAMPADTTSAGVCPRPVNQTNGVGR